MRIELHNESLTYTSKYLVLRKDKVNHNIIMCSDGENEVIFTKEEVLELSNTLKFMVESD